MEWNLCLNMNLELKSYFKLGKSLKLDCLYLLNYFTWALVLKHPDRKQSF